MSEKILIKNGRVIDPAGGLDANLDVLVENGRIADMGEKLTAGSARIVDAKGLVVSPGFIDLHVHLREPGYEYKETVETGAKAACAGGFTAVCCMANTMPVNDNSSVTRYILEKAQKAGASKVYPIGAVTKGMEGKELAEIGDMKAAGVVALSDDGRVVDSADLLTNAMEYGSMFGLTVVEHCEDGTLARGGIINEGKVSDRYGIRGIPSTAEESIAQRDMLLASYSGTPVHLAHVSCRGTVEAVRRAKKEGLAVTCEVTPHHFTLTEDELESFDTNYKMNPPLRTQDDIVAIKEGLKDGTIDAIATDHAPHARWEKEQELDLAPFGVVGLETALGLSMKLVEEGVVDLAGMLALFTSKPAAVFNLPGGKLEKGGVADICLFDPQKKWTVDPERFVSMGKNTPFAGWELTGLNMLTIVDGRVVYNPSDL